MRYESHDEYVIDTETGLWWEQHVKESQRTFCQDEAMNYCASLRLGTRSDWRLPAVDELFTLVNFTQRFPAIDPVFVYTQSDIYWSATTYQGNPAYAWIVYFGNGFVFADFKSLNRYVRAVRGGL